MKKIIFVLTAFFILGFSCNGANTGTGENNDNRNNDDELHCYTSLDCPIGYICEDETCVKEESNDNDNTYTLWKDVETDYTWTSLMPRKSWLEAIEFCEDLDIYGYSDWELPEINELRTLIINCPNTEPDGLCDPYVYAYNSLAEESIACGGCAENGYSYSKVGDIDLLWSSTPSSYFPGLSIYVHFTRGNIGCYSDKNTYFFRCFRK
jgi:hypothetical protein